MSFFPLPKRQYSARGRARRLCWCLSWRLTPTALEFMELLSLVCCQHRFVVCAQVVFVPGGPLAPESRRPMSFRLEPLPPAESTAWDVRLDIAGFGGPVLQPSITLPVRVSAVGTVYGTGGLCWHGCTTRVLCAVTVACPGEAGSGQLSQPLQRAVPSWLARCPCRLAAVIARWQPPAVPQTQRCLTLHHTLAHKHLLPWFLQLPDGEPQLRCKPYAISPLSLLAPPTSPVTPAEFYQRWQALPYRAQVG